MSNMICFVVTGYGEKTDYRTGRKLNLDKTYQHLVKPVFDGLGIECFRACDKPHSGIIDKPMYEMILKADIVVADISTLNPNAIYELGVRHALKPRTTIIIAEEELLSGAPFDLNHLSIKKYEHLGKDIGMSEVIRFQAELKTLVNEILANPSVDSPVYTFMTGLTPPTFTAQERQALRAAATNPESVTELLKKADELKDNKDYEKALEKYREALKLDPASTYIIQRMALATYKSGLPDQVAALKEAETILRPLNPETSNDAETLGLSGAICKRLYEKTGVKRYLERAKYFYERGFIVANDYYNGINLAFLLLLSASISSGDNRTADLVLAGRIRGRVEEICNALRSKPNFGELPDRVWVLLTLAEVAFCNGNAGNEKEYVDEAKAEGATPFDLDAYTAQRNKIESLLSKEGDDTKE